GATGGTSAGTARTGTVLPDASLAFWSPGPAASGRVEKAATVPAARTTAPTAKGMLFRRCIDSLPCEFDWGSQRDERLVDRIVSGTKGYRTSPFGSVGRDQTGNAR